jgi:two-component sensor histidine kinase
MKQYAEKQRRTLIISILLFLLLAMTIMAVGYRSYHNFEMRSRAQAESWLSTIETSKINGLADWRNDILKYANFTYNNQSFSDSVSLYLKDTRNAKAKDHVLDWLKAYQKNDEFDRIYLLNTQGARTLSVPGGIFPPAPAIKQKIPAALQSKQATFVDFYRDEHDRHIYLALLIPIIDDHDSQLVIGFLVLRVNPQARLYPDLARQIANDAPTQSFLVRREGHDAVYLNPLRFKSDAAFNLRIPMEQKDSLAVKATLGQTGIMDGVDYRGVEMIAVAQPVPDSPWVLVTHMVTSEVYAPVNENFGRTVIVTGTIIFYSGLGMVLIWRQRQLKYYQSEAEAAEVLRKTEDELRLLMRELDNKVRERTAELQTVNQKLLEEKQRAELLVEDIRENREQLRALSRQMVDLQEIQIKALARELHDRVGQNLTAININLSLLQQLLPENYPESIKSRLTDTSQIVAETVMRMRNIMADFLPPMLESYGLAPTLSWYGEQFTKRTNIPVNVNDYRESAARLQPETEVGLFRIVQEALNNVAKYAHAAQVEIEMKDDGDHILMTITDNGVVFDPQVIFAKPAHWGFAIMRERARALDVSFDIQSAPDKGVKILLRIKR